MTKLSLSDTPNAKFAKILDSLEPEATVLFQIPNGEDASAFRNLLRCGVRHHLGSKKLANVRFRVVSDKGKLFVEARKGGR